MELMFIAHVPVMLSGADAQPSALGVFASNALLAKLSSIAET